MEQRKEFGLRGRSEVSARPKEAMGNFERDRSMYERIRESDPTMDELLKRYDGIRAFQDVGHGTPDDGRVIDQIEKEIVERYKQLNRD